MVETGGMTAVAQPTAASTSSEALMTATALLQQAGIETARLDAEVLLAHTCGVSRSRVLAGLREPLPAAVAGTFAAVVARRARREPLAYIVEQQEFWSLAFEVSPDVLIPRPETELLVETAAAVLRDRPRPRVADVGTGSGCVAIALARELPNEQVWATDLSPAALAVARRNAQQHGVADRVRFAAGDLLAPITDAAPFDAICSNPPYVAVADAATLQPELCYEPSQALFAGNDGLGVIRRLLAEAPPLLARGGWLLVEIGCGQADTARQLAEATGFAEIEIREDYAGIPRLLAARQAR